MSLRQKRAFVRTHTHPPSNSHPPRPPQDWYSITLILTLSKRNLVGKGLAVNSKLRDPTGLKVPAASLPNLSYQPLCSKSVKRQISLKCYSVTIHTKWVLTIGAKVVRQGKRTQNYKARDVMRRTLQVMFAPYSQTHNRLTPPIHTTLSPHNKHTK